MPWERNFDERETLDKAMQAFWVHGFEATSMRDLVDCTGVNRASLYATYGDKRDLFLAALRLYDIERRAALMAELEARFDPREAVRRLFWSFVERTSDKKGKNRGCFLTNTALELAAHDREIGRVVARAQESVEAFFFRMIEKAKAQGRIARHVDPTRAARGLLAALTGLVVLSRSRPDRALLQSIVDDALSRLD